MPLESGKLCAVLNILSPANYGEFKRVLKPGGILIKVMPDADYLKELRRFIYGESDKNDYSNGDVLKNLEKNMSICDISDIKYTCSLAPEHIPALFDMTPLTQDIADRDKVREAFAKKNDFEITLAFKIAVCKKYLFD
jgi:23S rRNA (guanine745-N1)-methyltransferase